MPTGCSNTPEKTRAKRQAVRKGKTYEEIYGVKKAEEIKQKQSEMRAGYTPTKETKKKMSDSHMGVPKIFSAEHNAKISLAKQGAGNGNYKGGYLDTGKSKKEIYDELFEKQNGVCAICGKVETAKQPRGKGKINKLCIDHNHTTGKIRGLLCHRCNFKLGYFEDIEFTVKAKLYLVEAGLIGK